MFFHDQGLAQGYHEQYAQNAAAQRNQGNLNQGRGALPPFAHPHEQGRQGKDCAGCH